MNRGSLKMTQNVAIFYSCLPVLKCWTFLNKFFLVIFINIINFIFHKALIYAFKSKKKRFSTITFTIVHNSFSQLPHRSLSFFHPHHTNVPLLLFSNRSFFTLKKFLSYIHSITRKTWLRSVGNNSCVVRMDLFQV